MPLTVTALISMLGSETRVGDKVVVDIMKRSGMEQSGFASMPQIMRLIWKVVVNACGESTVVLAKMNCTDDERNALCTCLWTNLLHQLEHLQNWEAFNLMLDNVFALIRLVEVEATGTAQIVVNFKLYFFFSNT